MNFETFEGKLKTPWVPGSSPRMTTVRGCYCSSFPQVLTRSRCIKQRESSKSYDSSNFFMNEPEFPSAMSHVNRPFLLPAVGGWSHANIFCLPHPHILPFRLSVLLCNQHTSHVRESRSAIYLLLILTHYPAKNCRCLS